MSNDYYNPNSIEAHSLGRSSGPNGEFEGVGAGFDKVPGEDNLKRGKVQDAIDSGVTNAYVLTPTHAKATYAEGDTYRFRALNTNDGAATVNIYNASAALIGITEIRNYAGAVLGGGEIVAGAFTTITRDATAGHFRIANPVTAVASVSVTNNFKASGTDATPGTLTDKTAMQGAIVRRVLNAGGNEQHQYKLRETQAVPITANTTLGVGSITSIDTSGGAITALNAPAIGTGDTALQDGDFFTVKDIGGALETNNCTINFNGKSCRFMDQSADTTLIMNDNFVEVTCVWDGSADLWIATAIWKA